MSLAILAEATPTKPSDEATGGIWYVLVVVAVVAFVLFYVIKRISDIAVKRKTDALIREFGDKEDSNRNDD